MTRLTTDNKVRKKSKLQEEVEQYYTNNNTFSFQSRSGNEIKLDISKTKKFGCQFLDRVKILKTFKVTMLGVEKQYDQPTAIVLGVAKDPKSSNDNEYLWLLIDGNQGASYFSDVIIVLDQVNNPSSSNDPAPLFIIEQDDAENIQLENIQLENFIKILSETEKRRILNHLAELSQTLNEIQLPSLKSKVEKFQKELELIKTKISNENLEELKNYSIDTPPISNLTAEVTSLKEKVMQSRILQHLTELSAMLNKIPLPSLKSEVGKLRKELETIKNAVTPTDSEKLEQYEPTADRMKELTERVKNLAYEESQKQQKLLANPLKKALLELDDVVNLFVKEFSSLPDSLLKRRQEILDKFPHMINSSKLGGLWTTKEFNFNETGNRGIPMNPIEDKDIQQCQQLIENVKNQSETYKYLQRKLESNLKKVNQLSQETKKHFHSIENFKNFKRQPEAKTEGGEAKLEQAISQIPENSDDDLTLTSNSIYYNYSFQQIIEAIRSKLFLLCQKNNPSLKRTAQSSDIFAPLSIDTIKDYSTAAERLVWTKRLRTVFKVFHEIYSKTVQSLNYHEGNVSLFIYDLIEQKQSSLLLNFTYEGKSPLHIFIEVAILPYCTNSKKKNLDDIFSLLESFLLTLKPYPHDFLNFSDNNGNFPLDILLNGLMPSIKPQENNMVFFNNTLVSIESEESDMDFSQKRYRILVAIQKYIQLVKAHYPVKEKNYFPIKALNDSNSELNLAEAIIDILINFEYVQQRYIEISGNNNNFPKYYNASYQANMALIRASSIAMDTRQAEKAPVLRYYLNPNTLKGKSIQDLTAILDTIKKFQNQLETASKEAQKKEQEEKTEASHQKLRESLEQLETKLSSLKDKIPFLNLWPDNQKTIKNYEEISAEIKKNISQLETKDNEFLKNSQGILTSLSARTGDIIKQIIKAEKGGTYLVNQWEKEYKILSSIQQEIEDAEADTKSASLEPLSEQENELKALKEQAKQKIVQLETILVSSNYKVAINTFNETKQNIESLHRQIKEKLATLKHTVKNQNKEIKKQCSLLEKEIQSVEKKWALQKKKLTTIESSANPELLIFLPDLKNELETLSLEFESIKTQIPRNNDKSQPNIITQQIEKCQTLTKQLDSMPDKFKKLESKIQTTKKEREDLLKKINQLENDYTQENNRNIELPLNEQHSSTDDLTSLKENRTKLLQGIFELLESLKNSPTRAEGNKKISDFQQKWMELKKISLSLEKKIAEINALSKISEEVKKTQEATLKTLTDFQAELNNLSPKITFLNSWPDYKGTIDSYNIILEDIDKACETLRKNSPAQESNIDLEIIRDRIKSLKTLISRDENKHGNLLKEWHESYKKLESRQQKIETDYSSLLQEKITPLNIDIAKTPHDSEFNEFINLKKQAQQEIENFKKLIANSDNKTTTADINKIRTEITRLHKEVTQKFSSLETVIIELYNSIKQQFSSLDESFNKLNDEITFLEKILKNLPSKSNNSSESTEKSNKTVEDLKKQVAEQQKQFQAQKDKPGQDCLSALESITNKCNDIKTQINTLKTNLQSEKEQKDQLKEKIQSVQVKLNLQKEKFTPIKSSVSSELIIFLPDLKEQLKIFDDEFISIAQQIPTSNDESQSSTINEKIEKCKVLIKQLDLIPAKLKILESKIQATKKEREDLLKDITEFEKIYKEENNQKIELPLNKQNSPTDDLTLLKEKRATLLQGIEESLKSSKEKLTLINGKQVLANLKLQLQQAQQQRFQLKEKQKLKDQKEKEKEMLSGFQKELSQLEKKINPLKPLPDHKEIINSYEEISKEVNNLCKSDLLQKSENTLKELAFRIENLKNQIIKNEETQTNLLNKWNQNYQKINFKQKEIETNYSKLLQGKIKQYNIESIPFYFEQLNSLNSLSEQAKQKISDFKTILDNADVSANKTMTNTINLTETTIGELHEKIKQKFSSLNESIDSLHKEITQLFYSVETIFSGFTGEIESLEKISKDLSSKSNNSSQSTEKLNAEIENLKKQAREKQTQFQAQKDQPDQNCLSTLQSIAKECKDIQKQVNSLKTTLQSKEEQQKHLTNILQRIKTDKTVVDQDKLYKAIQWTDPETQESNLDEEYQPLAKEHLDLIQQVNNLSLQENASSDDLQKLDNQLLETDKKFKQLNQKIDQRISRAIDAEKEQEILNSNKKEANSASKELEEMIAKVSNTDQKKSWQEKANRLKEEILTTYENFKKSLLEQQNLNQKLKVLRDYNKKSEEFIKSMQAITQEISENKLKTLTSSTSSQNTDIVIVDDKKPVTQVANPNPKIKNTKDDTTLVNNGTPHITKNPPINNGVNSKNKKSSKEESSKRKTIPVKNNTTPIQPIPNTENSGLTSDHKFIEDFLKILESCMTELQEHLRQRTGKENGHRYIQTKLLIEDFSAQILLIKNTISDKSSGIALSDLNKELNRRGYVNDDYTNFKDLVSNLNEYNRKLTKDIYNTGYSSKFIKLNNSTDSKEKRARLNWRHWPVIGIIMQNIAKLFTPKPTAFQQEKAITKIGETSDPMQALQGAEALFQLFAGEINPSAGNPLPDQAVQAKQRVLDTLQKEKRGFWRSTPVNAHNMAGESHSKPPTKISPPVPQVKNKTPVNNQWSPLKPGESVDSGWQSNPTSDSKAFTKPEDNNTNLSNNTDQKPIDTGGFGYTYQKQRNKQ